MTPEENRDYILKTESLVRPRDITAISFLGDFNKYLPKKAQEAIIRRGADTVSYMGFIVDPYCLFASYEIQDLAAAQALLPDGYDLAETAMFKNGEKRPLVILSAFLARTSAFMGMRLEFYVIARSRQTGGISWIITDYETNTNSHDPKNGFGGYGGDPALHTTTPHGELLVDVKGKSGQRGFSARADLQAGVMRELDEQLWVEGNMNVNYGGALKDDSSKPFSLIFDPALMEKALDIPLDRAQISARGFLEGIINPARPQGIVVFPYSQHFLIRQEPHEDKVLRPDDLLREIRLFLSRDRLKTMSGDALKKPLFRSLVISTILAWGTILYLILRLLS